jgi:hypothetical protein
LICDEGTHFDNQTFKEFVNKLGVKELNVIPPEAKFANGAAESGAKKINNALKYYCEEDMKNWDELLPVALGTINKTIQNHGKSALELMYGVMIRAPGDLRVNEDTGRKRESFEMERMKMREEILQRKAKLQQGQKALYDKNRKDVTFEEGEITYVSYEPRSKFGLPAKIQPKFRRAKVLHQDSPVTYTVLVYGPNGKHTRRRVHVSRMKKIRQEL